MKHQHNSDFESTLHGKGLKSTPLRLAILDLLSNSSEPLTAEEISSHIKVYFDRATLFRSLKTFSEVGIISAVDLGEGFLRYEKNCENHHHHHHILCSNCKKIEIVPFCIPDTFLKHLKKLGYQDISHRMDFKGVCKECS